MTEEQNRAAKAAVDKHLTSCSVCHETAFFLNPDVAFVPTLNGMKVNLLNGQPLISVSCITCGHVILFNILRLGLGELFGVKAAEPRVVEQSAVKPNAE